MIRINIYKIFIVIIWITNQEIENLVIPDYLIPEIDQLLKKEFPLIKNKVKVLESNFYVITALIVMKSKEKNNHKENNKKKINNVNGILWKILNKLNPDII